ncbi:MAG: SPFH domain-containing protein [Armatimonadota bacterium]|nr:SPFH domain-containing protein [Armatimonadota bacterium]
MKEFIDTIQGYGPVGWAVVGGIALGLALLIGIWFVRRFLYICTPNQVLIFSGGGRHRLPDGTERGFRTVFGGRGWRKPFFEKVSRMSLNIMEVPIHVRGAYSKGGIALNVEAIANVKISSDPRLIGNAIERFLGRNPEEIRRVAKETLEGHLRGVLAKLTPEEVNEDRLKFAGELSQESEDDLSKLGIHLDTLKIQHVADDVTYLDSIGREAIANVIRDAEIAESDAHREAEQVEADALGRAKVVASNVDAEVARMTNDLRRIQAELESNVRSEEERTTAAAREARAVAEQELQKVRAELEGIRLHADRVLPADAQRVAREFKAQGAAASIREKGKAVSEALDLLHEAWGQAGENAVSILLIEDIEKIMRAASKGVGKIKIENLSIMDSGDGKTLAAYVAAYPQMLSSIFDAVTKTTGIDVPRALSGWETPKEEQV